VNRSKRFEIHTPHDTCIPVLFQIHLTSLRKLIIPDGVILQMKIMTIRMANVNDQKSHFTLIVLLSVILLSLTLPVDPYIKLLPCLFKSVFHIPCPGCGMTRAFILLGHFRFQEALAININSIFAYTILLAITINEVAALVIGRKMNPHLSGRGVILICAIIFCVMMAGWYYNLIHEGLF
jgi:hypothetical protein